MNLTPGDTPEWYNIEPENSEVRPQMTSLPQPGPTTFAYVSVDISAEIFFAWRASPVKDAENDKPGDEHNLRLKDGIFWESAEDIRAFVEQG